MTERVPELQAEGRDHAKIILDDSAVRLAEIKRFNKRLRLGLAITTLIGIVITTLYFSQVWTRENNALESRLETFTELRDEAILRYLTSLDHEVYLWSSHPDIVKDAEVFIKDWHQFSPAEIKEIREEYIHGAEPKTMSPAHLDYNNVHAAVHPTLEAFVKHHGYYDVFIFDLQGNLVYTEEKDDDFGTNLIKGPYKDSGLGRVYRAALAANNHNDVVFEDFDTYAPSNGAPAGFFASQIIDDDKKLIGIYAIQIPNDQFDEVLQYSAGLGETGETYMVGENFFMRNQSRLTSEPTTLARKIENQPIKAALAGQKTLGKSKNAAGNSTIVSAMPLAFKEARYAVATEMEVREKRKPLRPYIFFFVTSMLFLIIFGLASYLILRIRRSSVVGQTLEIGSS